MHLTSLTEEFYLNEQKFQWPEELDPEDTETINRFRGKSRSEIGEELDREVNEAIQNIVDKYAIENDRPLTIQDFHYSDAMNYRNLRMVNVYQDHSAAFRYDENGKLKKLNVFQRLWYAIKGFANLGRDIIAMVLDRLTSYLKVIRDKNRAQNGIFSKFIAFLTNCIQYLTSRLHNFVSSGHGKIYDSEGQTTGPIPGMFGNMVTVDVPMNMNEGSEYSVPYNYKKSEDMTPNDYGEGLDDAMNTILNLRVHELNPNLSYDQEYGIKDLDYQDASNYRDHRSISSQVLYGVGQHVSGKTDFKKNPFQAIWTLCKQAVHISRDAIALLLDKLTVWLRKVRDRNRSEGGILSKVIGFITNCIQFLTSRLHNFIQSGRGNIYDSEGRMRREGLKTDDPLILLGGTMDNLKGKISESYRPRFMPTRKTEFDYLLEEAEDEIPNFFLTDDFDSPTSHQGGSAELWDKVRNVCVDAKDRAAKSAGLGDKITIRSIVNKLLNLASSIMNKAREVIKNWTPSIKNALDKICNYIMDFVDYIKTELE